MVENFYSNGMGNFNGWKIVLIMITRSDFPAEYSSELGDTKKLSLVLVLENGRMPSINLESINVPQCTLRLWNDGLLGNRHVKP